MLKRLFKKKTEIKKHYDLVVCRIYVYNKAIKAQIAEYDIKESERHLIGAIRSRYPADRYAVDVVNY